ncbi:MAG: glycosyltransferase [Clostridia bacterium]
MKKITFLMLHLNYGGLEKQTITLINEFAKVHKFELEIVSVYDIIGKSFYNLDESVKVKYLLKYGPNKEEIKKCLNDGKYFKFIGQILKGIKIVFLKYFLMKKEIKNLKTDYIFSTRIEFSKQIKRKDTINISQEHSYIDNEKYINQIKTSFDYIDYLIVMTDKAKQNYEKWLNTNRTDIKVIPNMIEENTKYMSTCENKKIISVGRLEDVKDFSLLISIFSKIVIKNKCNDWKLEILGNGSLKPVLKAQIDVLGLTDNIKLIDSVPSEEVYKRLSDSSIFVLTSKSESFSLVLCEAMNVGLPVVSFDIDVGPREIINNFKTGYLINGRDEEEMRAMIEMLIDNTKLRKGIGSEAKKSVQKYYSSNIINKWLEILK